MVSLRTLAFVVAGIGVASFLAGLVIALAPPDPDCGGQGVYCQEAGYDRLRTVVVLLGVVGVVLLLAALGVYFLHVQRAKRAPPPSAPTPSMGAGVSFSRPAPPPKPPETATKPPDPPPRRPSR
ncbi:MAG TPA: hypothetical protein VI796_00765 [Candidatus Thermoplasmatota archaeon]|nr:hypothetical protein [Candidatus Thermoplasmatota archaeon]